MPDERWLLEGTSVAGTMLGSAEGSLFARGLTVLRRGDRFLIVQGWEEAAARGIGLEPDDWQARIDVDEATALEGPRPARGLVLWVFGEEFGEPTPISTVRRDLREAVVTEVRWPHEPSRTAFWLDEYRGAALRDEWANKALVEAVRAMRNDPDRAARLAEQTFHLRRVASPRDAALVVATREAARHPLAGAFETSMRRSFHRQRESFEEALAEWRAQAKECPSPAGRRLESRTAFAHRERQSLRIAA